MTVQPRQLKHLKRQTKTIQRQHSAKMPRLILLLELMPAVQGPNVWHPMHRHHNLLAHAPERLHEEFKSRIKAESVLPSADTAAMLFGPRSLPA